MVWLEKESDIDVSKLVDCQLTPVMSDVSAVPEKLLKMIHCNCKTACGQWQL